MQNHTRITGIIILIAGVILLLFPGRTLETLCFLLGWCLVISGVIEILVGVIGEKILQSVIGGVIACVTGCVFISCPDLIISVLPFLVGAATTVGGAAFLIRALRLENKKTPVAILTIIGSVAAIIAGIVLMVNAYTAVRLLMVIMGVFLVYFGIMRILKY